MHVCFKFKLQTRFGEVNIVSAFAYFDLRIYQIQLFHDFNFTENLIQFLDNKNMNK